MQTPNNQVATVNGYDQVEPAVDARDFLGSAYLGKEDLPVAKTVRLTGVQPETIPGSNRRKLVAQFEGVEKRLILNSTNIAHLASLFGTHNTAGWRGEITLYVDPNVTYAGRQVGGIRIKDERPAPSPNPSYNNGH